MSFDLRFGDCLDRRTGLASLAEKSIAHTIMDPPYEAEAHSKGRRVRTIGGGKGLSVKAISYPPITQEDRELVSDLVVRLTRGWALVFCQSEAAHKWAAELEAAGARYIRTGVYRKLDAQPQYSGDRPGVGWEAIVICWCGSKRPAWNGGGKVAIWEAAREIKGGYLVDGAKPIPLMDQLIADFTNPGDLVLDPYAGSGTTLLAAERAGRNSIGWEKKPEHYEIARRRLNGEECKPAPGQIQMFGGR